MANGPSPLPLLSSTTTTPISVHFESRNLSKQLLFDSASSSLGAFFPLVDLGLRAAVGAWWHVDRDKHWVQLLFGTEPTACQARDIKMHQWSRGVIIIVFVFSI